MGNWVAVSGQLDQESVRAFGEEVCIEPDKAVAREIDTNGDGKSDQVINFAPTFCPRDVSEDGSFGAACDDNALEIYSMGDGSVSHPIFTNRITESFPSTCSDGMKACTTFKSAEYYVGQFIPGDSAQQLAVINPDGSVQLFAWDGQGDGPSQQVALNTQDYILSVSEAFRNFEGSESRKDGVQELLRAFEVGGSVTSDPDRSSE